ncbi:TIGR02597 family protein [Verrucomicrobium spinosum]|uniref:TIGR02597 family protein n=1 Tax=Verrucomicrobium spinosum TaxID=2736 RepID=UPI0009D6547D
MGVNQAGAGVHIYNTSSLLPVGWHNNGTFASTGDLPIAPDVFVNVRNMGSQKSLVLTGRVPIRTCATTLATLAANTPQDNIVGNPFPIPVSLQDSNLIQSGAFTPTSDIDSPKDLLMLFKSDQVGHNIQPSHIYFYSTDPELGTGWFNLGNMDGPVDHTEYLLPGRGAIVRKAGGTIHAQVWPVPHPY